MFFSWLSIRGAGGEGVGSASDERGEFEEGDLGGVGELDGVVEGFGLSVVYEYEEAVALKGVESDVDLFFGVDFLARFHLEAVESLFSFGRLDESAEEVGSLVVVGIDLLGDAGGDDVLDRGVSSLERDCDLVGDVAGGGFVGDGQEHGRREVELLPVLILGK